MAMNAPAAVLGPAKPNAGKTGLQPDVLTPSD